MKTFLGIDGGGSKTRALLVDAEGKKLHSAESGPSNPNAHGEDIVRASITEVVEKCIEASGSAPIAACFGIAGAGAAEAKAKLEAMIEPLGLEKTEITTDAAIALEGAFNGGPGILLIAGTGSVCFGKSTNGEIHRTGGWGWLADDAGSAAWIGQRGLALALQQNDGRIAGTALRNAVFDELKITSRDEIIATLHQPAFTRSRLGELAPCVLHMAKGGDTEARRIQQQALDELEKMIRATAKKMQERADGVACSGGLLMHHPNFREELETRLFDFKIQEPLSTPLEGAVALARKI